MSNSEPESNGDTAIADRAKKLSRHSALKSVKAKLKKLGKLNAGGEIDYSGVQLIGSSFASVIDGRKMKFSTAIECVLYHAENS